MASINGTTITIPRGDYFACAMQMYVQDPETGEETLYELQDGETAWFAMKADYDDTDTIIHKQLTDDYVLEIFSRETEGLEFGTYYYDAYLLDANGERTTYIRYAKIKIDKEVHT